MALTIPVTEKEQLVYEIELTRKFDSLLEKLKKLGYHPEQKICIVTDSIVSGFYAEEVQKVLKSYFDTVIVHIFPAGESNKNLATVNKLYEYLIKFHFDRHDVLIALGGGVVGDLTGFTAATYLRGIDFIQVPTTLLSQVDSSIGGKTGVDFQQYKNMVGAFYQPKLVYMNLEVLNTLPKRQISSGMGEILKHGLIKDRLYFSWIQDNREEIKRLNLNVVEEMIYRSCNIKRLVVEHDPKETGERALLNFGHTIGHAIEKLSDFRLFHGECVALGMAAAAFLSYRLGNLTKQELEDLKETLALFELPIQTEGMNPLEVLQATKSDKKMEGNQIKFILLAAIGNAYIYKDLTEEDILEGIRYVCPS